MMHYFEQLSFEPHDLPWFGVMCALITTIFYVCRYFWKDSRKKQAWVIMLISSFVLGVIGCSVCIHAEIYDRWTAEHMFTDAYWSRVVMIFFASANIMDLVLGYFYYPEFLYPLTTIAHHIFFILVVTFTIASHNSHGFLYSFPLEVPTFFLAVGTMWDSLRLDLMFGLLFFIFRIAFHILLIYRTAVLDWNGVMWKSCCFPLMLHFHWFHRWVLGAIKRHWKKEKAEDSSSTSDTKKVR
jgi:hypothetical protein